MHIFFVATLLFSSLVFGQDDDFNMRVSWVKTIKELALEIEKKHPDSLSKNERSFLESFSLISKAYADARFNCFYGGWPSSLKNSKCQHPKVSNPDYKSGACSANEFSCEPMLFGHGHCVPSSITSDSKKLTQSCENKFKAGGGSYDHLKNLSQSDADRLREMSLLASSICTRNDVQGGAEVCSLIKKKFDSGMRSLDRSVVTSENKSDMIGFAKEIMSNKHPEDCEVASHDHSVTGQVEALAKAASSPLDELYESMKSEFQKSPMCDPYKIINNPEDKPSPIIMGKLVEDLKNLKNIRTNKQSPDLVLNNLQGKYGLSEETKNEVLPHLKDWLTKNGHDDQSRMVMVKIQGLIIQDFIKNYKHRPDFMRDEILEHLADNNIFKENDEGEIECPFISKDAFMKAIAGQAEVLKKHGKSVSKKNQITIVDYSRPSNERRLFVIDLNSKKVLHNTWVAHGAGAGKETKGIDGKGSSPQMSNVSGSRLSSDGFIIATTASYGNTFGPNVLLKGIDKNNTNLAKRDVIVHKWNSPYAGYAVGTEDYNSDTGDYGPTYDVVDRIRSTDFKNSTSLRDMERAFYAVNSSTHVQPVISGTEGCLGVPLINIKHLDRKGRNKSQLEALREDLPGSVVFNYSGPEMKSNYLK